MPRIAKPYRARKSVRPAFDVAQADLIGEAVISLFCAMCRAVAVAAKMKRLCGICIMRRAASHHLAFCWQISSAPCGIVGICGGNVRGEGGDAAAYVGDGRLKQLSASPASAPSRPSWRWRVKRKCRLWRMRPGIRRLSRIIVTRRGMSLSWRLHGRHGASGSCSPLLAIICAEMSWP